MSANGKREDYITWDQYFMGITSCCPPSGAGTGSQVGACIVSQDSRILSVGYNGMPAGCTDDQIPGAGRGPSWEPSTPLCLPPRRLNAILNNSGAPSKGTRLYSTLFLQQVRQGHHPERHIKGGHLPLGQMRRQQLGAVVASKQMFQMAGVAMRQYRPQGKDIVTQGLGGVAPRSP